MRERGFIHAVRRVLAGSVVTEPAPVGATTVFVEDAVDFDETGGTLVIDGNEYVYASADMDENTIELAEPLQDGLLGDELIHLLPLIEEIQAVVLIGDNDESLQARIPHGLSNLIPDGIRDEGLREGVEVEMEEGDDEWVVKDVFGKYAIVEGMAVDVTTLPPVPNVDNTPDGFPPNYSPTPNVMGGLGLLFITYDAVENHDAVTYQVYVSATSPVAISAENLVEESQTTIVAVTQLPDGSALVPETPYYVVVVATDVDGAAAPSAEASGATVAGVDPADLEALQTDLDQLRTDLGTANTELDNLQVEVDTIGTTASGKNKVYYQPTMPTDGQAGDLWFDTDDGFRIYVHDGTTFVDSRDTGVEQAAQDAAEANANATSALTAANGKNRVTYSAVAASGTSDADGIAYVVGDTWFQQDASNVIVGQWEFDGAAWVGKTLSGQVIASLDAGKITSGFIDAARINAGTITSTHLADGSVSSTKIVGGTITTSHIIASGIDAGVIAFGTMSGDRIAANTLNASKIVAGSITTDRMTVNSINGDRIIVNTLHADKIVSNSITSDKLSANAITASMLIANNVLATAITSGNMTSAVMTGAKIQTTASANQGIKLDSANNSFSVYNSAGTRTVLLDGNTGSATITGTFKTTSGSAGVFIDSAGGFSSRDGSGNSVTIDPLSGWLGSSGPEIKFGSSGYAQDGQIKILGRAMRLQPPAYGGANNVANVYIDESTSTINLDASFIYADKFYPNSISSYGNVDLNGSNLLGCREISNINYGGYVDFNVNGGLLRLDGGSNYLGKISGPYGDCAVIWQGNHIVIGGPDFAAASPNSSNTRELYVDKMWYFRASGSASDATLKKDVTSVTSAVDTIKQVDVKKYRWIESNGPEDKFYYGVIAQEVQEVVPEIVEPMSNGKLSVAYDGLYAITTAAVKELIVKNENLEARVLELEATISG